MNPVLRHSAAHVFVSSLEAPALDDDDAHHLFRVLRLRDGEVVTVSDGRGCWRPCSVRGGTLVPTGPIVAEPAAPPCHVLTAIPKGDRLDWMAQKLTEVGVTQLTLVDCARSVVRWQTDRAQRQRERLLRIIRDAAMQSRRTWLPELDGPVPFEAAVRVEGVTLLDPSGVSRSMGTAVLIGPEGGFAESELACGAPVASLGDTVLRVETAAVVAAVKILT